MALLPYGTYSFSELVGTLVYSAGVYTFAGQKGLNSITIEQLTTRATQQMAADGWANTSFQLGANARVTIEIVQTSDLDSFLLGMSNATDAALAVGDSFLANAGVLNLRHVVTGKTHSGIGVAVEKKPNRGYAGAAAMRSWSLLVSEMIDQ